MHRPGTSDVSFRVLGPVEVTREGETVALRQGTQLDLLVALLMAANETVSADNLTETVWSARIPAHPRPALHNAIARLRRVLVADVIETLPRGYRLCADAGQLDLLEFDRLLAAASSAPSDPEAEALLAEALGLWRGKPLQHVESPVLLNSAAPQLADRYVDTCERWAGLCLRMGRHEAVVTRLAALVEDHPFREQLMSHFILALYRSGRQAEALAAYDSLRRGLSEEMGIEPGRRSRSCT